MRCRSLYITHEPKEKKFHLGVSSWYTFSATLAFVLKKTWVNVTINYAFYFLIHASFTLSFPPQVSKHSLKNKKKKKEKTFLYLYLLSLSVCLWLKKQNLHVYSLSFCWFNKVNRIAAPDTTTNHMSRASSREQRNFQDHTETIIGPNDITSCRLTFINLFFLIFYFNLCILICLWHSRCSIKN